MQTVYHLHILSIVVYSCRQFIAMRVACDANRARRVNCARAKRISEHPGAADKQINEPAEQVSQIMFIR